ncbi:MAG TPA: hypothetical protein VEJ63_22795 [Planctomycetota bacterium]|nr:hypothetical protein [Planctomycetota bacterium]
MRWPNGLRFSLSTLLVMVFVASIIIGLNVVRAERKLPLCRAPVETMGWPAWVHAEMRELKPEDGVKDGIMVRYPFSGKERYEETESYNGREGQKILFNLAFLIGATLTAGLFTEVLSRKLRRPA